jgi:hypothetical protein
MRSFLKFVVVLCVISVPLEIATLFFPLSRDIASAGDKVSLKCGSLMSPITLTLANDAVVQDGVKNDLAILASHGRTVPKGKDVYTWMPTDLTDYGNLYWTVPADQLKEDRATCAVSRAAARQFMLWVSPVGLIGCIVIVILAVAVVGFALGGGGGGGGITIRGSARPALGGRGWWVFRFWKG